MDNMLKKYSEKIKLINKFIWDLAELGIAVAISGLGNGGLSGLIAVGIILWLFGRK